MADKNKNNPEKTNPDTVTETPKEKDTDTNNQSSEVKPEEPVSEVKKDEPVSEEKTELTAEVKPEEPITEVKTEEPATEEKEEEPVKSDQEIAKEVDAYLTNEYETEQKVPAEALLKRLSEKYRIAFGSVSKTPHFIRIVVGESRLEVPFKPDRLVSVTLPSKPAATDGKSEAQVEAEKDPLLAFAEKVGVIIEDRKSFIRPFTKDEISEFIKKTKGHPEFSFEDNKKIGKEDETALIFSSGEGENKKACRLPDAGFFKIQL